MIRTSTKAKYDTAIVGAEYLLRWLPRGQWGSVDWLPGDVALIDVMESGACGGSPSRTPTS